CAPLVLANAGRLPRHKQMATIANNAVRVTDFLILMRLPSFSPAGQSNVAGLRPSTRRQTGDKVETGDKHPETNLQTFYSFWTSSRHLRLLATLAFRGDKYRPQIYSYSTPNQLLIRH